MSKFVLIGYCNLFLDYGCVYRAYSDKRLAEALWACSRARQQPIVDINEPMIME